MSRGIAEAITETDRSQGLSQVMAAVMEKYADRPALGERVRKAGELLPEFDTITYRELWARVRALAARWRYQYPLEAGHRIAVLGFTSIDYATIDLACIHNGVVSVPLQSTAPLSQLRPIIAEAEPTVLAASVERLGTAVEAALEIPSVQRVIVFDYDPSVPEQREAFEAAEQRVVIDSLASLVDEGWVLPPAPLAPDEPEALALLLYTSGSTGTPKGAMYPQRLAGTAWYGFTYGSSDVPPVVVHYMPMSHLAGRYSLMTTLANGGTGYFTARSDLSTLFEDIALARPTELTWVPRVVDMLYQQYQSALDAGAAEDEVLAGLRENFLGGRVTKVFVGTAPLSAEMVAFLENCLRVTVHTGLGSTEAGGILLNSVVQRPPVLDYKLVDVPELGYFTTDKPHPRGELLLRTSTAIPGYYRRPELTAEFFDADGYYRTGDVMAEIGPDRLVVVGRTKDTLKLSQGEFVSPSRLESVFVRSPLVRQIFVYGNSSRSYLLAVVVPVEGASKAAIAESLQDVARSAELNSYEIPRDFLLEPEPFSAANGLLAESHKPRRPQLVERYGAALEALYDQLAAGQTEQLRALRQAGAGRPVLETVGKAAQALLGVADTDLKPDAHFTDLGGDSLSALAFSRLMKDIFGVDVPVGVVISPANDLTRIAEHIETASGDRPTFESVHGDEVRAADLTLDKFFDTTTLSPGPRASEVRTVLLTGATGYLGRFLCLEWLERLAPLGGKVICVVRAGSAAVAEQRLASGFASDPDLLARYRELSGALEVIVGDIAAERFGLDDDTWTRLADTVDAVVHPAALVNHVLPYAQLFGPNVVGTAEVIRLALSTRIKPVSYVSTVAVQYGAEPFDEDADIRVASPARQLDDSYANGYATSKWAGEVLLREAHERFGLPVATFRPGMILAHNRFGGQVNVPDLFTRLLFSIVVTGLAPRTFYRTGGRAHYDALPVDFVASAVTRLGVEGYRTFNVVNPHDDGISLDTFVDWLSESQPIRRIDDYDEWLARLTTAMRALPEKQRQSSLLPTLHAFARPREVFPGSAISTKRFHDAVGEIPHLSAALIHKYVADLRQLNVL